MGKLRVVVDRPCEDPAVTFEERPEGRFCLSCGELQHDLTGATRSEAIALIRAHGGRLCGTFRAGIGGELAFRPEPPARGIAARGAALALALAGCGTASEPSAPPASSPPTSIAAPPTEVAAPPSEVAAPPTEVAVDHSTDASPVAEDHAGHAHTHDPVVVSGMHVAGGASIADQDFLMEDYPRGSVRLEDEGIEEAGDGDFDRAVIVRMVRTRRAALQACYERALRNDPTLAGRVVTQLTIEESGHVSGVVSTENGVSDPSVGVCVTRVMQGFRFSPGPEGGTVTYTIPLTFAPAS